MELNLPTFKEEITLRNRSGELTVTADLSDSNLLWYRENIGKIANDLNALNKRIQNRIKKDGGTETRADRKKVVKLIQPIFENVFGLAGYKNIVTWLGATIDTADEVMSALIEIEGGVMELMNARLELMASSKVSHYLQENGDAAPQSDQ